MSKYCEFKIMFTQSFFFVLFFIRRIVLVPKPGYGLSSPNKSVTLPNSARYVGMVNFYFL